MDKEKVEQEILEEEVENVEEVKEETQEPSLEEINTALQEEVNKWKTDYYKVFADMENTKRRLQTEHANSLKFMMQSFVSDLLPVLDNFERSLNIKEPSEEIKNFLKGYEMIYKQLFEVLKRQGVEEIEALDKPFDPNYHQAVMMEAKEGVESGMVIEELQKGYKLKDRVIRASLVKVSE